MDFYYKLFSSCSESVTLEPGKYELEVWGARGGSYSSAYGGKGGYSKGTLTLLDATKVFVHVGHQGSNTTNGQGSEGCNGGGYATNGNGRSGGGATDIRLIEDSFYSRIIVAGGGGGSTESSSEPGGFGGGLVGGNGENKAASGKGAGQETETTTCRGGSTSCNKGTFGTGGNGGSASAGAGGGGWFGGSGSYSNEAGGGGSGYVLTSTSFKPAGYLLNASKYFLEDVTILGGDQQFPKPDKTGSETGHIGDGAAIINQISKMHSPTPSPDPRPNVPSFPPALNFNFSNILNDTVVADNHGKFTFKKYSVFSSNVLGGEYSFYGNSSNCGKTILADLAIRKRGEMKVLLNSDITVIFNNETLLFIPGQKSTNQTYFKKGTKVLYNYNMTEFNCTSHSIVSSLSITYTRPTRCTLKRRQRKTFLTSLLLYCFTIKE